MKRHTVMDRKTSEAIYHIMDLYGELSTEDLIEIIRPHCDFNIPHMVEMSLKRKANQMMQRKKDASGIRRYFACPDKYINVEVTKSIEDLSMVEAQLDKQRMGLDASINKVRNLKRKIYEATPIYHRND